MATNCVSTGEVLLLKFPSPPYSAVIEWLPPDSEFVVNAAWPEISVTAGPRGVVPSLNVTVPVGVPVPGTTTLDEMADELTAVVVFALFTFCVSAEVLILPSDRSSGFTEA